MRKDTSQKVGRMTKKSEKPKRDLAEEIDLLDTMLASLVDVLEEKGILTQEEWERRTKRRILVK